MAALDRITFPSDTPVPKLPPTPNPHPAPANVTIVPATRADIPALGRLMALSHGPELMMSFFFSAWPDTTAMVPYYTGRVASAFEDSSVKIFKAILSAEGEKEEEIVGLVSVGVQSGEKKLDRKLVVRDEEGPEEGEGEGEAKMKMNAAIPGMPEGVNVAFVMEIMKGLNVLDEIMTGRKHYLLSSLSVRPSHQNLGIGRLLVERCNAVADAAELPTYLTAFPGAYDLYRKMGYEESSHYDIDLEAWSRKKWRGFGIYRSFGMVREANGKA